MDLPVLVTFFNRPSTLENLLRVLQTIEGIDLFFAADGPRSNQDKLRVEECWKLVNLYFPKHQISRFLRREVNRGCKIAMKENLDWFFSLNPFGAILEDDCLPHPEFFTQMAKVLQEPALSRFMTVSGGNYLGDIFTAPRSSIFPMIWGWGTWAENWKLYDLQIRDSKSVLNFPTNMLWSKGWNIEVSYFKNNFGKRFSEVEKGRLDTWDYSLTASSWRHNRLNLHLGGNLVVNGGFNEHATHTSQDPPEWVPLDYSVKSLNLSTIESYIPSLDRLLAKVVFRCNGLSLMKNMIKKLLFK